MKITHAITIRKGDAVVALSTAERGPDVLNNLCAEAVRTFARTWAITETEWIDDDDAQAVEDMRPPVELDEMPPLDG